MTKVQFLWKCKLTLACFQTWLIIGAAASQNEQWRWFKQEVTGSYYCDYVRGIMCMQEAYEWAKACMRTCIGKREGGAERWGWGHSSQFWKPWPPSRYVSCKHMHANYKMRVQCRHVCAHEPRACILHNHWSCSQLLCIRIWGQSENNSNWKLKNNSQAFVKHDLKSCNRLMWPSWEALSGFLC